MDWEKAKLQPRISAQSEQEFNIVRRIYQQEALNKDANYVQPKKPFRAKCKKIAAECGFYTCILNALPFVRWIPKYKCKDNIVGDLSAGLTTAIMHIPQGMAYALLAEVPPVVGLYMAFFPVLVYVFFGTSPHVSIGTFAVACLMTGKIISQHAHPVVSNTTEFASSYDYEPGEVVDLSQPVYEPLQVLSIVCLSVGIFQILMWIFRLGAVSTLLSEPLVSGFTTACAFQVIVTQIKDLLGITLARVPSNFKVIYTLMEIVRKLPQTNTAAVVMSLVACTIIAVNNEFVKPRVGKRSRIPVPIELLAVVIGTVVSRFGHIHEKFGIKLVGHIPTGLPSPRLPPVELFPAVALDAFTITLVTYTITMSMAFMFAAKDKYDIDPNQELLALGAGNVFGAFFWCAPVCASLSRSFIQYQAGAKTCVTSIVSAVLILLVLLWVGPVFEDLPRCVLASIIVVSLKGMLLQIHDLIKFYKLSILDAIVWLVTFLVTLLINIDIGLALGILANLATLYSRAQRPYTCLLGRVLQTDLYLDIKRYRGAEELPGIKIFHYCGGLNFATKNLFRNTFFRKVGIMKPSRSTENLDHEEPPLQTSESFEWDPTIVNRVQCVIIDATALCYVDGPGIKTLVNVELELAESRITVLLAGANGPVLEMIDRYNKLESQPLHVPMFPTVHDAVVFYRVLEAKRSAPPITINSTTNLNPRE